MKSRQISGIHFFSILLQLLWLYVIGAPFLNLQYSENSFAGFDLHLVIVYPAQLGRINLGSILLNWCRF